MGNFDDLSEWLRGCLTEGVGRLELLRTLDNKRLRDMQWPTSAAANDTLHTDDRVRELVKIAERDAANRHQREVIYCVWAFRPGADANAGYFAEHTFTCPGKNAANGHGNDLAPVEPTMVGVFTLLLRHIETKDRALMTLVESRNVQLERMLDSANHRAELADKRRLEVFELLEQLGSAKADRELSERRALAEEKRDALITQKLDVLMPIAMNRLLGGGPGTNTLPAGQELIKQLFGKMQGERLEQLMSGGPLQLSPDEALLVAEIYSTFGSQERAREAMQQAHEPRPLNQQDNGAAAAAAAAPGKEQPS
jgi:hypothetical protein